MPGALWVVAEVVDGSLARISTEVATIVRELGEGSGRDVVGIVIAADAQVAAKELARYLPRVVAVDTPLVDASAAAAVIASAVADLVRSEAPSFLFLGASPDGRDVAGILSAVLGWGVLANATRVSWDAGPLIEMNTFGGRTITSSAFTGAQGIVTVRLGAASAAAAASPGGVEAGAWSTTPVNPVVAVLERVSAASAAAPIEEAKIIVAGGRGVGGSEGFRLVEELAEVLGGAVGASRAAVDAGWIPYSRQIGQTGKIVKPALYLALGISGAIQHKVGMQTAGTIVAVNRDPDAPIAEFADMLVVGDLFEVVPALTAELRARMT
jgi:electron transfer flavoprotein alpha subunit